MASLRVGLVSVTAHTADRFALVYAALHRKGRPIPSNDPGFPFGGLMDYTRAVGRFWAALSPCA